MIRVFIDGQRMAPLGGPGGSCVLRIGLGAVAADGERQVYHVAIEAKEARIVTTEGGAAIRRILLLAPPEYPPEPGPDASPEELDAWQDWTPGDRLETVANFVNLDTPAEVLAGELRQAFQEGDHVAAVERLLGARRTPE